MCKFATKLSKLTKKAKLLHSPCFKVHRLEKVQHRRLNEMIRRTPAIIEKKNVQIVILKLRQKTTVTAADHDQRHWKAAKVIFCPKYLTDNDLDQDHDRDLDQDHD